MSKVMQKFNMKITPAADGKRYSKYPEGATTFDVSVFATIDGVEPGYQLYYPETSTWSQWFPGTTGGPVGFSGVTSTIVGDLLPDDIVFSEVLNAPVDTLIESNAVLITAQGHQIKVRRKSSVNESTQRQVDVSVGNKSSVFRITTLITTTPEEPPTGDRNLLKEIDWETGQVEPTSNTLKGCYVSTLPEPQIGDEYIGTGSGGFGPSTSFDFRVMSSYNWRGTVITPRKGSYFAGMWISKDKNYLAMNNYSKDKPRGGISTTSYNTTNGGQSLDYDTEAWFGMSVYLPPDYEHEQFYNNNNRGENTLLSMSDQTRDITFGGLTLWPLVPHTNWMARYQVTDQGTTENDGLHTKNHFLLGPVNPDLGQWTDFIFRIRSNPFSVATNPAQQGIPNAQDKLFQGNKGIFQVWKSEGSPGNRQMVLKVNIVDQPTGFVPRIGRWIQMSGPRQYKYGWKNDGGTSTSVVGPIFIGFDEIRYGEAEAHGTRYSDVHPDREVAP